MSEAAYRRKPPGTAHTGRHSSVQRLPLQQPGEGTCKPAVPEPGRTARPSFYRGQGVVGCDAGTCPAGVSAPRSICFFPGCGPGPLLALGRFAVAQPHRSHLSVLVGCQAGRHRGKGRMAGGCWHGGTACAGLRGRGSGGSRAARPGWSAAAFPPLRLQLGILGPCLPPPTMPLACSDQRTRERLRGGLGHQTGLTGGV